MKSLIYVSVPSAPVDTILLDIVRCTEKQNELHSISGMMIYCDYAFLQLIEGPEASIDRLLRNLEGDIRHRIIGSFEQSVSSRRIGASLPMGYSEALVPVEFLEDLKGNAKEAYDMLTASAHSLYPAAAKTSLEAAI